MRYSKDFLRKMDESQHKEKYAKITLLNNQELPIETVEGRITAGSINIDGNSAVRRTCSLTMVSEEPNYHSYYWTFNSKFKLEVGLKNDIDPRYPDIIWFKQGIFIITSFSTSHSTNNFTINLQGKDKMCRLNGEVGGTFNSEIDFGSMDVIDADGITTNIKLPIKDIIRNMLHAYASEPYHNIIINDLDTFGLELLEYRYDNEDLFLYRPVGSPVYQNALLERHFNTYGFRDRNTNELVTLNNVDQYLENLNEAFIDGPEAKQVRYENEFYYLTRISYGQTAGYRKTELVYSGDLIAKMGEAITSVLDKIKGMLSEFEYFYDVDGRFIFQKKQSFINTLWTGNDEAPDDESEAAALAYQSNSVYDFTGSILFSSFNNNPNLSNLKNDFTAAGERETASGASVPIHFRYAIDRKPVQYTSITVDEEDPQIKEYNKKCNTKLSGQNGIKYISSKQYSAVNGEVKCDWREIIYAMAQDYFKYNFLDDFELRIIDANPDVYPSGLTGYEQYYVDILSFWRDLYFPDIKKYADEIEASQKEIDTIEEKKKVLEFDAEILFEKIENIDELLEGISKELKIYFDINTEELPPLEYIKTPNVRLAKALNTPKAKLIKKGIPLLQPQVELFKGLNIPDVQLRVENFQLFSLVNELQTPEVKLVDILETPNVILKGILETPLVDLIEKAKAVLKTPEVKLVNKLKTPSVYFFTIKEEENEVDEERKTKLIREYRLLVEEKRILGEKLNILLVDIKMYESQIALYKDKISAVQEKIGLHSIDDFYLEGNYYPWCKISREAPERLNFWFDFLDTQGRMAGYSVPMVSNRAKVFNDSKIKSIYYRETPNVIYVNKDETVQTSSGYVYVQLGDTEFDSMFSISAQGLSAKDKIDELIYNHFYCIESVTINSVPIYYLEPNVRVHLFDIRTGVEGDYIVSRLSIPLAYNGTMSITATKAAERII